MLEASPSIRDVPSAMDVNISARCEMDLSPGTRSVPLTRGDLLILIFLDIATSAMLHKDAPGYYLDSLVRYLFGQKQKETHPRNR